MEFYGIQLYNLTPNLIVFLSIFVHLCKGFLGVLLDLDLFRHFFELKVNTNQDFHEEVPCSYRFSMRPKKSTQFIEVKTRES